MISTLFVFTILSTCRMASSDSSHTPYQFYPPRPTFNSIMKAMENYGHRISFIYNNNFNCIHSNRSDCQRLEFRLKLKSFLASSARVYISYSIETEKNVSILWPFLNKNSQIEDNWMHFDTTSCLKRIWNSFYHCTIEVTGISAEKIKKQTPFLVITEKAVNRKRRSLSTCSVKDRYVHSEDLQEGDAYPITINIKECAGKCHVDYSDFKSRYGRTMYLSYRRNNRQNPDETWTPKCQITEMGSINLFVRNGTGYVEKEFKNMVVVKCGCTICEKIS